MILAIAAGATIAAALLATDSTLRAVRSAAQATRLIWREIWISLIVKIIANSKNNQSCRQNDDKYLSPFHQYFALLFCLLYTAFRSYTLIIPRYDRKS